MSIFQRLKFHILRYRGEIVYSSVIIASLMMMIGLAFPKDNQAIAQYVDLLSEAGLDALFATVNVNAPGWLFWVSLMGSAYTYFVSVIAGIRIGSKLFPTEDDTGLELIASSPKPARLFYLENIIAAMVAIVMIFLPGFIILSLYSISQDAVDTIPRLGIMFLLNSVVALFFAALSSVPSSLRFSSSSGAKLGYLYLFSAFLVELTAGSIEEYKELANYSVNYYVSPSTGLLDGEFNWQETGIVVAIVIILFMISIFMIKKPEYIQKISPTRKFSIDFLPNFSPQTSIAKRYPLLFDQFRKDRSYVLIWGLVVNIAFFYIAVIFNLAIKDDPTVLTSLTTSFGGIMDVFTFGYDAPATYTGFLTFEVFGLLWLYFGLFVFIPAINIPNRDQAKDEQDLIWSNSITPERVISNRTLALMIYFTVYYWISFLVLWSTTVVFDLELDFNPLVTVFSVGYIYFLGLILLFIGMTMLFPIRSGKKVTLWFYIISILVLILSFLESSLESLKYVSIVYYYDPVGLLLEKIEPAGQFLNASIILLGSALLYYTTLTLNYRKSDLLT